MTGPNKAPFSGVAEDLKGRAACYKQDWNDGFSSGFRFACYNAVNACKSHYNIDHRVHCAT
jgi:superfamily I DNA and RNA helicase